MLVPLASEQDRVAEPGQPDRPRDRGAAVVDDPQVLALVAAALERAAGDLAVDRIGVLAARILVGHDHRIRQAGGDPPHLGALEDVALSRRAEHHQQATGGDRPQDAEDLLQRVRRVGVVDDDRERLAKIHAFHAARRAPCMGQGHPRDLGVDPPSQGEGERGEGVLDVEGAGQRDLEPARPARGPHLRDRAAGIGLHLADADIGLRMGTVAQHPVSRALAEDRPGRIVAIEDRHRRLLDEQGLGIAVCLERAMELEVLVGDVGDDPGPVPAVADPTERQAMGRGLDHGTVIARGHHLRQELLELKRLGGRGPRQVVAQLIADLDVHRAKQSRPMAPGTQQLRAEGRDSGLPVGARHPDRRQCAARLAEPQVRGVRQRVAAIGDDELRDVHVRHLVLDHHGGRPRLDGGGCEPVTVGVLPRHCEEEGPIRDAARVVGQLANLADRQPDHPLGRNAVGERCKADGAANRAWRG